MPSENPKSNQSDACLSLAALRQEYSKTGLSDADLNPDPILQFQKWFQEAKAAGLREPNAMVLATATLAGRPSVRVVLLKDVSRYGFVFFTNYESQKAHELTENPQAALNFPWVDLERQVSVVGSISRVSRETSEAYFKLRPRGSRLGAWASPQSQVIPSRAVLEDKVKELEQRFPGEEIPLPPQWGGFVLSPLQIEFWQGRASRLHDRFRYTLQSEKGWRIERLAP